MKLTMAGKETFRHRFLRISRSTFRPHHFFRTKGISGPVLLTPQTRARHFAISHIVTGTGTSCSVSDEIGRLHIRL